MTFEQRASTVNGVTFIGEIQYQSFTVKNNYTEEQVIAGIINGFDSSPRHKQIMAWDFPSDPGLKPVVGISVIKRADKEPGYTEYIVVIDIGYIEIP
jgi:hypothetical protein